MPEDNAKPSKPTPRRDRKADAAAPELRNDPKPPKPPKSSGKRRRPAGRDAGRDLAPLLKGWDYESGTINVRKVKGADGSPKLQMRLDLGLLQMELHGRPDGARPHGCESLLDYFQSRLARHRTDNEGDEGGFGLTPDQCQMLREEAVMYYHRYLSLFVLRDYKGVVRDTARNLRVLDLCGRFAVDDGDKVVLEQYRPYIVMMNTRASASVKLEAEQYAEALESVRRGLRHIKRFYRRFGHEEAYRHSGEARVLRRLGRRIKAKIPVDPLTRLQRGLDAAVAEENYERAAELRDEIAAMNAG